ncbi:MAG: T9SS type A sorting domain-containing protein [Ignavibacteriae bacterium]|nr:T9SS type A sorting domain-containing protein [Ignavibacteriota bacterium]
MKTHGMLCLPVSLLLLGNSAYGQWSNDPSVNTEIFSETFQRTGFSATSDGHGGAFVVWEDQRRGPFEGYLQHINESGLLEWQRDGLLISSTYSQFGCKLVSDDAGGCIAAWRDYFETSRVHTQRFNANGEAMWLSGGVQFGSDPRHLSMAPDGFGGALVVWGSGANIFAQKVNSQGALQWTASGVQLNVSSISVVDNYKVVSDGTGGGIIAWTTHVDLLPTPLLVVQRVDALGNKPWGANGVSFNAQPDGSIARFDIASNRHGDAFLTWMDQWLTQLGKVRAQRIDSSGNIRWPAPEMLLSSSAPYFANPVVAADEAGNAMVAWQQVSGSGGTDVYAQRFDSIGVPVWNPVRVVGGDWTSHGLQIIHDGADGAILSWLDTRNGEGSGIYAGRITASGSMPWATNGTSVCSNPHQQWSMLVVSDFNGGGIAVWNDSRKSSFAGIYAQRLLSTGDLPRTIVSGVWSSLSSGFSSALSSVDFVNHETGWTVGGNGSVFHTTDGGGSWTPQFSGTTNHFSSHDFITTATGWAVGQGGVIVKTTNGGASWFQQSSGTTAWLNFVQAIDTNQVWAVGENSNVLRSTDGGSLWYRTGLRANSNFQGMSWLNSFFPSNAIMWFVGTNGVIVNRWGDGSWHFQTSGTTASLNAVKFADLYNGWIVGEGGLILLTTNGGTTWTQRNSGTTQNLNAIHFTNPSFIWAAGDGGTILFSSDRGNTWIHHQSATTENLRSLSVDQTLNAWAVGLNGTMVRHATPFAPLPVQLASFTAQRLNAQSVRLNWTTLSEVNNYGFYVERRAEGATAWTEIPNGFISGHGTTIEPHHYAFTDNNALQGVTQYRLKQVDLDRTEHLTDPITVTGVTSVVSEPLPTQYALHQNYPNPFNPTTTIKFDLPERVRVKLEVFDILGRSVAMLVDEERGAGSYNVPFDATNVASGIYLYTLTTGEKRFTSKMLLAR